MIYLTVVHVWYRTTNQLIIHNCTENTSFYLIFFVCFACLILSQINEFGLLFFESKPEIEFRMILIVPMWNQGHETKPLTFYTSNSVTNQEDLLLLNCEDGIVNLDSGQLTPTNEKVVSQQLSDCQNFAQSYSIPIFLQQSRLCETSRDYSNSG